METLFLEVTTEVKSITKINSFIQIRPMWCENRYKKGRGNEKEQAGFFSSEPRKKNRNDTHDKHVTQDHGKENPSVCEVCYGMSGPFKNNSKDS